MNVILQHIGIKREGSLWLEMLGLEALAVPDHAQASRHTLVIFLRHTRVLWHSGWEALP